jgi:hypothetical protein
MKRHGDQMHFLLSIAGRKPLGWRWFVHSSAVAGGSIVSFGVTPVQAHAADEANCLLS